MARSPELFYAEARRVFEKYKEEILSHPDVISADVGMKMCNGCSTRELAICIYVEKKVPLDTMDESRRIPEDYDGIPSDVQDCMFRLISSGPRGGDRIRVGTSSLGTLGTGVIAQDGFARYVTCAHVISPTNEIVNDTPVLDQSGNKIGTAGSTKGLDWTYSTRLDCALIRPTEDSDVPVTIPDPDNPIRIREVTEADMMREVVCWHIGATSGKQMGYIVSIDANPPILDGTLAEDHIKITTKNQTAFARDGDSGSILCIGDCAIGIVRAVTLDPTQFAIACPLTRDDERGAADVLKFDL